MDGCRQLRERSSPIAKSLKRYLVRAMSKTQLVQHLRLSKCAKKLEPQSIIQVLATCDGLKSVHFGHDESILSTCWVAPWAPSAISNASYFILDASFYALRPYVYCVPHVIHCNTSIPIGISVAASETAALYEQFFNLLPGESREKLREKICITDEGSAVQSFLSSNGIQQVLCHRHLMWPQRTLGMFDHAKITHHVVCVCVNRLISKKPKLSSVDSCSSFSALFINFMITQIRSYVILTSPMSKPTPG